MVENGNWSDESGFLLLWLDFGTNIVTQPALSQQSSVVVMV